MVKNDILITGGTGLIGSALVNKLARMHYKSSIRIISKNLSGLKHSSVEYYRGNFKNKKLLNKLIRKNSTVIHLACSSVPSLSEMNRPADLRDNLIGTINLLDICVKKKIQRLIFVSSGGTVYGKLQRPAKEEDHTNPISSHGVMKLAIEKYIQVYNNLYGLPFIIIRASNVYGPGQIFNKPQGIIGVCLKKAMQYKIISIYGNGGIMRDYIYVDDFADALMKILSNNIKNEIINIGYGKTVSLKTILKNIKKICDTQLKIKRLKKRKFDVDYNALCNNKAFNLLGWRPKTTLLEGIKKTHHWLKSKNK